MSFKNGWHVLYVKSRCERKVYQSLQNISLESFLPQVKDVRQWSDRKKIILKPLFPSYLFVKINSALDLYKVLSINGACDYIRFGNEYALVTEKEINQIKILLDNFQDVKILEDNLDIKQKRKINSGLFSGYECEIINYKGKDKIIVIIESLKLNIVAELNSIDLLQNY